jgi:hypothetical protein
VSTAVDFYSEFLDQDLSLLTKRASQAERDPRLCRSEAYITAQLLLGISGHCGGTRASIDNGVIYRHSMIRNARVLGLFEDPPIPQQAYPNDTSPQAIWLAWVRNERRRRLGWAVYVWIFPQNC